MAEATNLTGITCENGGSDELGDDDFVSLIHPSDDRIVEDKVNVEELKSSRPSAVAKIRKLPPWMDRYVDTRRVTPLVALHNEIVGFCKLMEPHPDELKEREALVEKFSDLVNSTFKTGCKVEVFGSQVTGLCLPTSDIDIAIQIEGDQEGETKEDSTGKVQNADSETSEMDNWSTQLGGNPLQQLGNALRDQWQSDLSYLEVIENTRVPLVKFTHAPTNISVDVCFNQKTGVQAATLMKRYMDAIPPLRPLTFVLKYFLASRGLNEPYTGGVGSFMLQLMIVSFLQNRERDAFNYSRASLYNLGALLVEFLELYSTDFNYVTTGFSVRYDGFYFPKGASERKEAFFQQNRPFSMSIENPLETGADVGKPSFRMQMVQRSFEVAFKLLLCYVSDPVTPTASILASILPVTDEMVKRLTFTRLNPLQSKRSDGQPRTKKQKVN